MASRIAVWKSAIITGLKSFVVDGRTGLRREGKMVKVVKLRKPRSQILATSITSKCWGRLGLELRKTGSVLQSSAVTMNEMLSLWRRVQKCLNLESRKAWRLP